MFSSRHDDARGGLLKEQLQLLKVSQLFSTAICVRVLGLCNGALVGPEVSSFKGFDRVCMPGLNEGKSQQMPVIPVLLCCSAYRTLCQCEFGSRCITYNVQFSLLRQQTWQC
jgi:hypothetical protein